LNRLSRLELFVAGKILGNEFVAEQPRLFARSFGSEAAQERQKRRQIADVFPLSRTRSCDV
jgi:hypothetical protein